MIFILLWYINESQANSLCLLPRQPLDANLQSYSPSETTQAGLCLLALPHGEVLAAGLAPWPWDLLEPVHRVAVEHRPVRAADLRTLRGHKETATFKFRYQPCMPVQFSQNASSGHHPTYNQGEDDSNTPPVESQEERFLEVPGDPANSSTDDDDVVV